MKPQCIIAELKAGNVDTLAPRPANKDGAARGPRAALKKLRIDEMTEYEKDFWLEKARIDAILGGARLSMKSLKSGLRCYVAFVGKLCQYAPFSVPLLFVQISYSQKSSCISRQR